MVGLIFNVISENVVVFDAARCFKRSMMNILETDFFAPWHQEKEYATISIASTVKFYRNAKAPKVGLQQLSLTIDATHTSVTPSFFDVLRHFLTYLIMSLVGT